VDGPYYWSFVSRDLVVSTHYMWKINAIGFLEIKCKLLVKLFSPPEENGVEL